jgi:hypothetical protein
MACYRRISGRVHFALSPPVPAAVDDCFARRDAAYRTIELATREWRNKPRVGHRVRGGIGLVRSGTGAQMKAIARVGRFALRWPRVAGRGSVVQARPGAYAESQRPLGRRPAATRSDHS